MIQAFLVTGVRLGDRESMLHTFVRICLFACVAFWATPIALANPAEPASWQQKAMEDCLSGSGGAFDCQTAGETYSGRRSDGSTKDAVDASIGRQAFARGCELGDFISCGLLGDMAQTGAGGAVDLEIAESAFKSACELDQKGLYPKRCVSWGVLATNRATTEPDHAQAYAAFDQGCAAGSSEACARLAVMDYEGHGAAEFDGNTEVFRQRLTNFCSGWREPYSCWFLGYSLQNGPEDMANPAAAFQTYMFACQEMNFLPTCVEAMHMLKRGEGVEADEETADRVLGEICSNGYEPACMADES